MRIRYVRIQGYRGLADVHFSVGDGVTLVGKNNAGKSSILEAIGWFFHRGEMGPTREDVYTWWEEDDFEDIEKYSDYEVTHATRFLMNRAAEDIRITLGFGDVLQHEVEWFQQLAGGGESILRRLPDAATEEDLLVLQRRHVFSPAGGERSKSAPGTSRMFLVLANERKELPHSRLWPPLVSVLPSFVKLDARTPDYGEWLRLAMTPLARSATIAYLQATGASDFEFLLALDKVYDLVDERIGARLSEIGAGGAEDEATFSLANRDHRWMDRLFDPPPIDIPRQLGDGAQRRLLVSALKLYEEADLWGPLDSLVLAIEEPELFLHPEAQRKLAGLIKELRGHRIQTFVSTHSAIMVDRASLDDVVLVQAQSPKKQRDERLRLLLSGEPAQTIASGDEVQRRVIPLRGREQQFREVLDELGHRPSDVLYATCAVLVEGDSDKKILEVWAEKLGYDLQALGVTWVTCQGNRNTSIYANGCLFQDFGVPFMAVLDGDRGRGRATSQAEGVMDQLKRLGLKDNDTLLWWPTCIEAYLDPTFLEEVLKLQPRSITRQNFQLHPVEFIEDALRRAGRKPIRHEEGRPPVYYPKSEGAKVARLMTRKQISQRVEQVLVRIIELAQGSPQS